MKIYFCDLCNESIPQEDLEQNKVTSVRGKMICARCVPPAAGAPVGGVAAAPATASGGGRMVALLALIIALGGAYLAWDSKSRLDSLTDPSPRLALLEKSAKELHERAASLDASLREQGGTLSRVGAEPAKLREDIAAQLARIEGIERSIAAIDNGLTNLRADGEKLSKFDIVQGRFEHELGALKTELANAQARIEAIGAAAPSQAPAGSANPAAADAAPALDAETKKLLADFSSKDGSVRWSAVDRIARRRDPTLLPYLLPMLDDSDAFVQFRAIGAMRELNAKGSVGRLVKLLRDNDGLVREEAQDTLVQLTGNPMHFDGIGGGTPADREKGAKAWEEWFEKNKARFEEPAAPAPPANG